MIVVLLAVAPLVSLLLTGLLRRYALQRQLLDIPNARSSHTQPTPRGGGVAIVVTFMACLACLALLGQLSMTHALGLLGAGGLVAWVGFLDDHGHLAARWRLAAHFVAAFWALAWIDYMPSIEVFGTVFDAGYAGYAIASLYLVWMLNLYNFMDGIDGIASVEAICVAGGGALLYGLLGLHTEAVTPMLLAAAVAGFLVWNFPPARIFMGDAGSGFLGISLGILSLQAAAAQPRLLWSWLILLGVFIVDATWTLFRRLLRGDKLYEAHRSHAYQYASRRFGRHLPVTLSVLAINICWLLPIALGVGLGGVDGALGIAIAYVPLIVLAGYFRAGAPEQPAQG